ncbi:cyclin G [Anoplophora glabripennis]|uniref:cyclin G n=1 Tax=Anoplophora glabripennis TaxID=217634 RepID=UPI000873D3B6|nr:cyclin G [Anoplophora glabripennis]
MDQASKRRGRPSPDAGNMKPIAFNLEEALAVENIYRPNLLVIQEELQPWEVTVSDRDRAVNILRLLRIWFDVPHNVFFTAATYLDLFLSRLKVQEKYLNCLTVSCFYVAAEKEGCNVDANQLVAISKNFCMNDLNRMVKIVKEKLKLDNNDHNRTTTCADFLIIYLEVLEYIMSRWMVGYRVDEVLKKEQLLTRLEILLANNSCAFFRSSVLALVLLKFEIEKLLTQAIANKSMHLIGDLIQLLGILRELQFTCKIKSAELVNCSNNASNVMKQYDNQNNKQHSSTIEKGNRYRSYYTPLSTIEEKTKSPCKKN